MRLCRFLLDDVILTGFYADDRVIPLAQAAEAFGEAHDTELLLGEADDLLPLLPPAGEFASIARLLAEWVGRLEEESVRNLAIPADAIELLAPIPRPGKLLMLAGNYAAHVTERGGLAAERTETFPYVFLKPTTTIIGPGEAIRLPAVSPDHVDWECELGVVIGATCRHVEEADALDYVAGYTVVNDISDRKFTPNPGRKPRERDKFFDWLHGKGHDTFCPIGPCLLSAAALPDPQGLAIRLAVNGQVKQDASTSEMVFPVAALIAFLSSFMTLEPGDVISTGTPAGVGSATGTYLRPGDVVEATITGIGTLRNLVETEQSDRIAPAR